MSKSTHYIEILKIKQLIAIWKEIPSRNKPRGKSWIVNEWILREQYNLYSARFWEHYSWSLVLQLWNRFIKAKPLMRKVRTSMRHLLAEKRAIHGTWYTSYFFRNKTFLFDLGFRETSQNFSSFRQTKGFYSPKYIKCTMYHWYIFFQPKDGDSTS